MKLNRYDLSNIKCFLSYTFNSNDYNNNKVLCSHFLVIWDNGNVFIGRNNFKCTYVINFSAISNSLDKKTILLIFTCVS